MSRSVWLLSLGLGALVAVACSSSGDSTSTGTTSSGGGAAGGAQAGGAQAGGAQAGAGAGGSSQGGSSQAGGGQAGGGQGGQAGASSCCATVKCGGAHPVCVEGACFDLKPGECFSSAECGGAPCDGAILCPCGSTCKAGTQPGHCSGAPPSWATCGVPGECTLAPNGCCAGCGQPTTADLDAVNRTKLMAHHDAVCSTPTPSCPKCATMQNPDLLAACALGPGQCKVVEVSKSGLSVCATDGDCMLRPAQCCACGEQPVTSLVALAKAQESSYLAELGCANVDCAPCADPVKPPAGVSAKCEPATGHCKVQGPLPAASRWSARGRRSAPHAARARRWRGAPAPARELLARATALD